MSNEQLVSHCLAPPSDRTKIDFLFDSVRPESSTEQKLIRTEFTEVKGQLSKADFRVGALCWASERMQV